MCVFVCMELTRKEREKKGKKKKIEEFENLSPLQFNLTAFWLVCFCIVMSKKKKGGGEGEEGEKEWTCQQFFIKSFSQKSCIFYKKRSQS